MKNKILYIFSLFFLFACKKEKAVNYTFTITSSVFDNSHYPTGMAFLYDENNNIVDEDIIRLGTNTVLTSPETGKHHVAFFGIKKNLSSGSSDDYQFDFYYDVPNGSFWQYDEAVFKFGFFEKIA